IGRHVDVDAAQSVFPKGGFGAAESLDRCLARAEPARLGTDRVAAAALILAAQAERVAGVVVEPCDALLERAARAAGHGLGGRLQLRLWGGVRPVLEEDVSGTVVRRAASVEGRGVLAHLRGEVGL